MADHGETSIEIQEHAGTYDGFTKMMTWGTAVCVLLAAIVVFLIAS